MHTIGASFSGGGFRATAFTFGCLDLLHHARQGERSLLQHVAFSSSTSGGSLAMAYHAVRSYRGDPFPEILAGLRTHMKGEALLAEAMRILEEDAAWAHLPGKSRNLINAFSIAYDQHLFNGATLGLLANKSERPPIDRYCFNATELNHGLSFRFDHNGDANTISDVGNKRQHFAAGSAPLAHQLRMADIAAASSCFPVGFEPLVFPHDFEPAHAPGIGAALVDEDDAPLPPAALPFGVVDGGAVDNQGLRGLQIEAGRRTQRGLEPFDLMISCDVSSFHMYEYEVPEPKGAWSGGWKVGHVLMGLLLAAGCIVAGLGIALWQGAWVAAAVLVPPAALVVIGGIAVWRSFRSMGSGSWVHMVKRYALPLLGRMSLRTLRYFVIARLRILGLLLNNVFMNEIRRQQYRALYEGQQPRVPIVACMVYELAQKNTRLRMRRMAQRLTELEEAVRKGQLPADRITRWTAATALLQPSRDMMHLADSAAAMPTTLWFDTGNAQRLDHLLACGRFTLCYNLLVHLADEEAQVDQLTANKQKLREQLLRYWQLFLDHPTAPLPNP